MAFRPDILGAINKTGKRMDKIPFDSVNFDKKGAKEDSEDYAIPLNHLTEYLETMEKKITRTVTQRVMQQLVTAGCSFNKPNSTSASLSEVAHKGVFCDHCDSYIFGVRYKCGNCEDYDLCEQCEDIPNVHDANHIFLKIRSPLPTPTKTKRRRKKMFKPYLYGDSFEYPYLAKPMKRCKMDAEFICDVTISDGTVIKPGVKFVKSWRVINSGLRPWTKSTSVKFLSGSEELKPQKARVAAPLLLPGDQGIVSVMFTSPKVTGFYRSNWGFHHNDEVFGHQIWCSIEVRESLEDKSNDNVQKQATAEKSLEKSQESDRDDKVIQFADALTAVHEVQQRMEVVSRKLAATSHTATPNNTPFDLTPPKSPEPQDVSKETQVNAAVENVVSSSNKESDTQALPPSIDTNSEKQVGPRYITLNNSSSSSSSTTSSCCSSSNSDSDVDFVVIPMPKCFTLEKTDTVPESPESDVVKCSLSSELSADSPILGEEGQKEIHFVQQVDVDQVHSTSSGLDVTASERVSQETGAPEVAECISVESVVEINEDENSEENEISASVEFTVTTDNADVPACDAIGATSSVSLADVDNSNKCTLHKENISQDETLPKLLVSGNSSTTMSMQGEKTIQVLPEGLVTGALSAAASVYNAARAVISNIQVKNERENSDVTEVSSVENTSHASPSVHIPTMDPMTQLIEMGFCNRARNEQLLKKYSGDVAAVVAALVNMNDNDWYSSRHSPETFAFD